MNVTLEKVGDRHVAHVAGRLDFGAAAPFEQQLTGFVAAKPAALVLDCAGLEYVSSAGLRAFLVAARAAKAAGVPLSVCALQPAVREVFDVSGFSRIIDIRTDLASALA